MMTISFKESGCCQRDHAIPTRSTSCNAFSLLEIIAVLAVLAILAAAVLPAVIKQADFAAQNIETTNLVTFANAFQRGALRQRYLPDANAWYSFIATNAGWQTNAVVTNSRNNARVFLIDPSMSLGLPYSQDTNATGLRTMPSNLRFMIVSSMAQSPLPSITTNDFNNLWATPDNTIPIGTIWSNFKQGSDVLIQRINLSDAFRHLVLIGIDKHPVYTIGTLATNASGTGLTLDGYFFTSTPYGLLVSGGSGVETVQILLQDTSYSYQCGIWWANPPFNHSNLVGLFSSSTNNPYSHTSPALICADIINYMSNYTAYALSGYSNATLRTPLTNSQQILSNDVNSLSQTN